MLEQVTVKKLNRTFFSDEKVFKVHYYRNSQNYRVYAPCDQKRVKFQIRDFILVERIFPNLLWCQYEYQNWVKLQSLVLRKEQRLFKIITVVMFLRLNTRDG